MKRLLITTSLIAALAVTALGAGASAAPNRGSGTLELHATFRATYRFRLTVPRWEGCPSAVTVPQCLLFVGEAVVPGLGQATATYTKLDANGSSPTGCEQIRQNDTAVIKVAGKGEITLSRSDLAPVCTMYGEHSGPYAFTITGGSGTYAGASGSAQFESTIEGEPRCIPSGCTGNSTDTWTATLNVPGLDFDLTPPVLNGAASKTVKVPKKAKRVRVRYAVTAQDDVDGSVAVACKPGSGTFFKLGRRKVSCSATDSSGNTATASFTITVKRRR